MTALLLAGLLLASADQSGRTQQRPAPLATIDVDGHVAVLLDVLPRQQAREIRPELRLDIGGTIGPAVRFGLDALAQGLTADRDGRAVTAAAFRPRDAWLEIGGRRGNVRAGYGRVVWGRLDEVQPSDVVNPIDAARFLLDGRGAARLPVWFARARLAPSDRFALEAVVLPLFRRGTFDELEEASSPFNLVADELPPGLDGPVEHVTPPTEWRDVDWKDAARGARMSATIGRVDVAVAGFRGYEAFGVIQAEPVSDDSGVPGLVIRERHTRFTMLAADTEAVAGNWALRGEAAFFRERSFAGVTLPGIVRGRALEAGVGVDRSAGALRIFATVLMRRQWSDEDAGIDATDVSVLGSIERTFGRERYRLRLFGVANPEDEAGFLRALFSWSVRDNVAIEVSAAGFFGDGDDPLSRFKERDFGFTRLIVYF
jgi:hypothetical protein